MVSLGLDMEKSQGVPHKSKTADQISHYQGVVPDWFNAGIKALLLAPSALNRQPYIVNGVGNKVSFKGKNVGLYHKLI